MKKVEPITAEEFDRRFDDGEDMSAYMDWSRARRPGLEIRRINVDLPAWIINNLDFEARRCGVTRQSVLKMWLVDRIEVEEEARNARRAAEEAVDRVTAEAARKTAARRTKPAAK